MKLKLTSLILLGCTAVSMVGCSSQDPMATNKELAKEKLFAPTDINSMPPEMKAKAQAMLEQSKSGKPVTPGK